MDKKQKAGELVEQHTYGCHECDNAKLSALQTVDGKISELETVKKMLQGNGKVSHSTIALLIHRIDLQKSVRTEIENL